MQQRTSFTARILPVVLALGALCTTNAFAAPPANTSPDIIVVSIRGDVLVTMAGVARDVRPGSVVTTPAHIRTGRNGYIELRQGPTTASVASDSAIEIAASSSPDGLVERIVQTQGNVLYDVGKRTGRKLRVETAYLVAVIKGTQFNVSAEIDSATIALFEGRLEIWTPDATDFIDLNAGEIAARRRTDTSIHVLSLDSGETLRAATEKPAEKAAEVPVVAATSTAAPASETASATPVAVTEQVVARAETPDTRVDTTRVDTTPAPSSVETVVAAPAVALTVDVLNDSGNNGKGPDSTGPPGQDPLGLDSRGKGPGAEGPPGHDRLDGARGNSGNAPGHQVDAPALETTVSAPALETTIVTTVTVDSPVPVIDAGVTAGIEIANPALAVDPPVVEDVVKLPGGVLGR